MAAGRKKPDPRPWQRMLSGKCLNLSEPSALDVEIDDIAHGLSRVARWNGQTHGEWAYSVAQHSLLVEQLFGLSSRSLSAPQKLVALLHDAPEYVIGDLISPFKAIMGAEYKKTEKTIFDEILFAFNLREVATASLMRRIKKVDRAAAYLEALHLAGFKKHDAEAYFPPQDWVIEAFDNDLVSLEPLRPNAAKQAFIARFNALIEARDRPSAPPRSAAC